MYKFRLHFFERVSSFARWCAWRCGSSKSWERTRGTRCSLDSVHPYIFFRAPALLMAWYFSRLQLSSVPSRWLHSRLAFIASLVVFWLPCILDSWCPLTWCPIFKSFSYFPSQFRSTSSSRKCDIASKLLDVRQCSSIQDTKCLDYILCSASPTGISALVHLYVEGDSMISKIPRAISRGFPDPLKFCYK